MRTFNITKPNENLRSDIQNKIDNLNKPRHSLGMLEDIAMQICLVQQTLSPELQCPCHLLFGADHGIEREGVSVSPRSVTWQQMINFSRGGGGVNVFSRQHNIKLRIIDVGVDHDLTPFNNIIDRKIAPGTCDFLYGPAMTEEQFDKAIDTGAEMVDICKHDGCNIINIGEMGIANTSPSSIWMHLLGKVPLQECIGAGAGLSDEGIKHKREVLETAVERYKALKDEPSPLSYFGGFEMVAAIGAMLRAAEQKMIVLVDGFIMTACMLAASTLYPDVLSYAVFCHCGDESGHRRMLDIMNAQPILNIGLRLGEGTGALIAYPIIESAIAMINEMNNFENAKIDKYF